MKFYLLQAELMILGSSMAEMILFFRRSREQMLISMLKTRLRSLAQDILFLGGGGSCSASPFAPVTGSAAARASSGFFFGTMSFRYL